MVSFPDRSARPRHNRRAAGFTLIEVMVVVVIVGVVSSMLLLSFGLLRQDQSLQQQGRRLASLLELAVDEATLQGRDFGLEVMLRGYRFVEHDPILEVWDEMIGDDILRPRKLEDELEFELFVEDRRILLREEAEDTRRGREDDDKNDEPAGRRRRDLSDDYAPHVLILSSGDISPFSLRIVRATDRAGITMTVAPDGVIEIESDEDDDL